MKKSLVKLVATSTILAAFCFLATLTTQAKPKHPRHESVVTAVDTIAKTVTIRTAPDSIQTYHLTALSQITVNGESATIDKIHTGMHADISIGGDKATLTKIDLTGTDTPTKKKKKK